jgi:hypothetical protein
MVSIRYIASSKVIPDRHVEAKKRENDGKGDKAAHAQKGKDMTGGFKNDTGGP